jgi:hypothetical protein
MKVSEILDFEKSNTQKVYLIKEGIFWRAYEVSAFIFTRHIKPFKLLKKLFKCVKQNIVYIGFPVGSLKSILEIVIEKGFNYEKISEEMIILDGFSEVYDFEEKKSEILMKLNSLEKNVSESDIIRKIKNYPIANKSPLEAMSFVAEIQKDVETLISL